MKNKKQAIKEKNWKVGEVYQTTGGKYEFKIIKTENKINNHYPITAINISTEEEDVFNLEGKYYLTMKSSYDLIYHEPKEAMKIELGKEYPTKEGGKAIVHSYREGQGYPYLGEFYSMEDQEWCTGVWNLELFSDGSYHYSIDLEEKVDVYFYRDKRGNVFTQEEVCNNPKWEYLGKATIKLSELES